MPAPHVALWEKKRGAAWETKKKEGGKKKGAGSVAFYAFTEDNAQAESGRLDAAGWICSGRPGAVALIPPA